MTVKELDDIIKDLDNKRQRKRELQKAKAQAELSAIDREYEAYFDGIYDAIKAVKAIMPEPTKMEKNCDNCGNYGKIPKADDCGMCLQARLSNGVLTDPSHWKPKTQQPAEGE
jgi:hypothetical protein